MLEKHDWKFTAFLAVLGFMAGLVLASLSHCQTVAQYAKPDTKLTPGDVDPTLEADLTRNKRLVDGVEHNICAPDFVTPPFRVATKSEAAKTRVCRAYGITSGCPGRDWELDDAVPVELGGKNVEANLWPQPVKEARVKDHKVEDLLGGPRGLVCAGKITLVDAQRCVRNDWVACMARVAALKAAK